MLGAGARMLVAMLAIISVGFGTFATYAYLSASQGRVGAASIICLAYAALALTVAVIEGMRRRNSRLRRALTPASTSVENVDSLLQSTAAMGAPQDQQALLAAMQLGRALSPAQLVVLALIVGFIIGRKRGK